MIIRPKEDWIAIGIVSIIALFICSFAHASIPEESAVRATIGEALTDYDSLYAIACALRNRDTLKGVYGHKAVIRLNGELVRVIKRKTKTIYEPISASLFQRASKAWVISEDGVDVVKGATHWLSDYDLKHCKPSLTAFRFKMTETAYIGKTHFYKE